MGRIMDWEPFLQAFQRSILAPQWTDATHHYLGKGLHEGFDVGQARRHVKYYEALGQHFQRSLLLTTLAGGIWTKYRRHTEFGTTDPFCPRCEGLHVVTDFH